MGRLDADSWEKDEKAGRRIEFCSRFKKSGFGEMI
jgi:hypothetical protein